MCFKLTYTLKISSEYKFDSGIMYLYTDGASASSQPVNMNDAASSTGFRGNLNFGNLGNINTVKLENLVYNGRNVSFDCSYRFVS